VRMYIGVEVVNMVVAADAEIELLHRRPNEERMKKGVNARSTDRPNYSVNRYCPTVVSFK
jgi:hypothetical protein